MVNVNIVFFKHVKKFLSALGIVGAALPLRSNGALLRGTAESPAVLLGRQLPDFFTGLQLYLLELIL